MKNVGGTPGGLGEFVIGFVLAAVGFYLLTQRVQVTTGGWYLFGYNAFGLSLLPFLFGVGLLAFGGRAFVGWLLTLTGLAIVVAGILMNLSIYFVRTSLWDTLLILGMLAFGLGFMARALRPHQPAPTAKDER
ncbi:hypothetical protein B1810_06875 [Panacagrimonas perspica]|nr:hypothetical protein B1810_06875 [Panacagrimonas perspica]